MKKRGKKVSVKKKGSSKKGKISRNDFEAFKFGVQRLKDLEKELNSLDTRGFSKEVQVIKSKLKTLDHLHIDTHLGGLANIACLDYRSKLAMQFFRSLCVSCQSFLLCRE